jgi:hypothetical protein
MNGNFASDNLEDKAVRHFLHATTLRRRFAVRRDLSFGLALSSSASIRSW